MLYVDNILLIFLYGCLGISLNEKLVTKKTLYNKGNQTRLLKKEFKSVKRGLNALFFNLQNGFKSEQNVNQHYIALR